MDGKEGVVSPIVFLDIDGVLVTIQSLTHRRERGRNGEIVADRLCVDMLNQITDATGAKIVVSSAWRFSGLLEMRAILNLWGVTGEVIDLIPDLTTRRPGGLWEGKERWTEIQNWIHENSVGLTRFVILDDIADMGPYNQFHVCTKESEGLLREQAYRAVQIIRGNE